MTVYVPAGASSKSFGPTTIHPGLVSGSGQAMGTNQVIWLRCWGSGLISSLTIWPTTSAGNISLGIYDSASSSSVPRNLLMSTGIIPCPPNGSANIPLPGSISVNPSHYFALGTDSTTSFAGYGSAMASNTPIGSPTTMGVGHILFSNSTPLPLPPVAPPLSGGFFATRGSVILIQGF